MISTDTGVQFIRSINILGLPKLLQGFLMFEGCSNYFKNDKNDSVDVKARNVSK
jgi:hypothetical protein